MKKTKTPSLVTIAVLTTITIFAWIFFDIYRNIKKPANIDVDPKILESINPELDLKTLDAIKERKYFDLNTPITPIPTLTISKEVKTATESPKEVTGSGIIQ